MLRESHPKWPLRVALGTAVIVLLAMGPAQAAKPKACPIMITKCGCVITRPDTYTVVNKLTGAQTDQTNCIEIAASNAILNLEGFQVYGKEDGTGIGIFIRKGADHVIVEGGEEANNIPPKNPAADDWATLASSGEGEVSRWDIGIEDDGNNAVIALFKAVGGLPLLPSPSPGNKTGGVFLNGVTGSFVGDLDADFNGKFGVMVKNSTNVTIANFSADHNMETGVKLEGSSGNSVGPGGAKSNDKYGIWLMSSSGNTIHDSNGNRSNGDTGILLSDGSDDNRVTNAGAPSNIMAGIVIQLGSTGNTVTVTDNRKNGNPNSDMIDRNPDCDDNVWYNNVGSGNQSCVQQ